MDAMSRSLCHIATTEDAGNRLDALCAARGLYASRSAAARAIEEGRVFVNGATVSKKHAVAAGDTIVYEVDDEPESVVVYGEPIDLDVRFEDEDMLVLSKQIGLVCHPSVDHAHGTLVNALIWHCGEENLCNVQGEEADRLGIVHRLDRDTSGPHAGGQDRRGRTRAHGANSGSGGRPPLHRARSRHHGPRYRHDRRAHRALGRRALPHGRARYAERPGGHHHLPRARALRGRPQGRRLQPHRVQAVHRAAPTRSACTCSTRAIPSWATRSTTPTAPATPGLSWGCAANFCTPTASPSSTRRPASPWPSPTTCRSDLQEALDALAERSLGKTDAGREVAELMAASPVPSVEGEVPDE